jgi:hypothetical protein
MQAASYAAAEAGEAAATVITTQDAINEIKGNGTDPANQYAASSPILGSQVAGYDKENLPEYRPFAVATGAVSSDGTRSIVQGYTESTDYQRTASTVVEDQPNEAASRIGQTTLGEAPERRTAPEGDAQADAQADAQTDAQADAQTDAQADAGSADSGAADSGTAPSYRGEITVPELEGHGEVVNVIDVTAEHTRICQENGWPTPEEYGGVVVVRQYSDGTEETISVDPGNPGGVHLSTKLPDS